MWNCPGTVSLCKNLICTTGKNLVDIPSQENATQNYKQYSHKKATNFLCNQKFKVGHKIMTSSICKIYKPDT